MCFRKKKKKSGSGRRAGNILGRVRGGRTAGVALGGGGGTTGM